MFVQEFLDLSIEPKGNSEEQKVKCPKCKSLGKENWKGHLPVYQHIDGRI